MLTGTRPNLAAFPDTIVTPTGPVDPYYSYVYGLWHLDTGYTDSGPGGRTMPTTSTTATFGVQNVTAKFGTGSLRSAPNATTLIRIPPNAALNVTGDFAFEFWMRTSGTQTQYTNLFNTLGSAVLSNTAAPLDQLGLCNWTQGYTTNTGATSFTAWINSPPNQLRLTTSSNPNDGAWHHIALTRSGTTCYLFFDGQLQASGTYSLPLDMGKTYGMSVARGTNAVTNNTFTGWIDDIRITIGVARYTSSFTIPSSAFPNSG